MKKFKPAKRPKIPRLKKTPTYAELADLVGRLTVENIANLDTPENRFVMCYTYGAGNIPQHWVDAIATRERLIEDRHIERKHRVCT